MPLPLPWASPPSPPDPTFRSSPAAGKSRSMAMRTSARRGLPSRHLLLLPLLQLVLLWWLADAAAAPDHSLSDPDRAEQSGGPPRVVAINEHALLMVRTTVTAAVRGIGQGRKPPTKPTAEVRLDAAGARARRQPPPTATTGTWWLSVDLVVPPAPDREPSSHLVWEQPLKLSWRPRPHQPSEGSSALPDDDDFTPVDAWLGESVDHLAIPLPTPPPTPRHRGRAGAFFLVATVWHAAPAADGHRRTPVARRTVSAEGGDAKTLDLSGTWTAPPPVAVPKTTTKTVAATTSLRSFSFRLLRHYWYGVKWWRVKWLPDCLAAVQYLLRLATHLLLLLLLLLLLVPLAAFSYGAARAIRRRVLRWRGWHRRRNEALGELLEPEYGFFDGVETEEDEVDDGGANQVQHHADDRRVEKELKNSHFDDGEGEDEVDNGDAYQDQHYADDESEEQADGVFDDADKEDEVDWEAYRSHHADEKLEALEEEEHAVFDDKERLAATAPFSEVSSSTEPSSSVATSDTVAPLHARIKPPGSSDGRRSLHRYSDTCRPPLHNGDIDEYHGNRAANVALCLDRAPAHPIDANVYSLKAPEHPSLPVSPPECLRPATHEAKRHVEPTAVECLGNDGSATQKQVLGITHAASCGQDQPFDDDASDLSSCGPRPASWPVRAEPEVQEEQEEEASSAAGTSRGSSFQLQPPRMHRQSLPTGSQVPFLLAVEKSAQSQPTGHWGAPPPSMVVTIPFAPCRSPANRSPAAAADPATPKLPPFFEPQAVAPRARLGSHDSVRAEVTMAPTLGAFVAAAKSPSRAGSDRSQCNSSQKASPAAQRMPQQATVVNASTLQKCNQTKPWKQSHDDKTPPLASSALQAGICFQNDFEPIVAKTFEGPPEQVLATQRLEVLHASLTTAAPCASLEHPTRAPIAGAKSKMASLPLPGVVDAETTPLNAVPVAVQPPIVTTALTPTRIDEAPAEQALFVEPRRLEYDGAVQAILDVGVAGQTTNQDLLAELKPGRPTLRRNVQPHGAPARANEPAQGETIGTRAAPSVASEPTTYRIPMPCYIDELKEAPKECLHAEVSITEMRSSGDESIGEGLNFLTEGGMESRFLESVAKQSPQPKAVERYVVQPSASSSARVAVASLAVTSLAVADSQSLNPDSRSPAASHSVHATLEPVSQLKFGTTSAPNGMPNTTASIGDARRSQSIQEEASMHDATESSPLASPPISRASSKPRHSQETSSSKSFPNALSLPSPASSHSTLPPDSASSKDRPDLGMPRMDDDTSSEARRIFSQSTSNKFFSPKSLSNPAVSPEDSTPALDVGLHHCPGSRSSSAKAIAAHAKHQGEFLSIRTESATDEVIEMDPSTRSPAAKENSSPETEGNDESVVLLKSVAANHFSEVHPVDFGNRFAATESSSRSEEAAEITSTGAGSGEARRRSWRRIEDVLPDVVPSQTTLRWFEAASGGALDTPWPTNLLVSRRVRPRRAATRTLTSTAAGTGPTRPAPAQTLVGRGAPHRQARVRLKRKSPPVTAAIRSDEASRSSSKSRGATAPADDNDLSYMTMARPSSASSKRRRAA